jgi:hypothetical protein
LKVIYNILLSAALIALGVSLIMGGFYATAAQPMAGTTGQAMPPPGISIKAVNPVAQPGITSEQGVMNPAEHIKVSTPVLNPAAELPGMRPSSPSGTASAQLVKYGTDKDTYKAGETAIGYITLKNTGSTVINDAVVSLSISKAMGALGMTPLGSMDFSITGLDIKPGETKSAEFSVKIPKQYSGFSTTGSYDLGGKVLVNGQQVGSFSKHINVV